MQREGGRRRKWWMKAEQLHIHSAIRSRLPLRSSTPPRCDFGFLPLLSEQEALVFLIGAGAKTTCRFPGVWSESVGSDPIHPKTWAALKRSEAPSSKRLRSSVCAFRSTCWEAAMEKSSSAGRIGRRPRLDAFVCSTALKRRRKAPEEEFILFLQQHVTWFLSGQESKQL